MLTRHASARATCQIYQPASLQAAGVPTQPSAPSRDLGANPWGRQTDQTGGGLSVLSALSAGQRSRGHRAGRTVGAIPKPRRHPGAGRQIRQARQGGDEDDHGQGDQGQEEAQARSWRACDDMHKCNCRSCTYVVDGGQWRRYRPPTARRTS